ISLIPTVINALGMTILVTNLFFLFISEGLKIYTLLIARKM
ncbi:putative membrane protein, partial [Yersinia pestis PY-54]